MGGRGGGAHLSLSSFAAPSVLEISARAYRSSNGAPASSMASPSPTSGPHPANRLQDDRKGYALRLAHPGSVRAGALWVRRKGGIPIPTERQICAAALVSNRPQLSVLDFDFVGMNRVRPNR